MFHHSTLAAQPVEACTGVSTNALRSSSPSRNVTTTEQCAQIEQELIFHLFSLLPEELLARILYHIFEPWSLHVQKTLSQRDSPVFIHGLPSLGPLLVNKWFHAEGRNFLHANASFTLTFDSNMYFSSFDSTAFDSLSRDKVLRYVRHIKNAPEDILYEDYLNEDYLPELRTVEIEQFWYTALSPNLYFADDDYRGVKLLDILQGKMDEEICYEWSELYPEAFGPDTFDWIQELTVKMSVRFSVLEMWPTILAEYDLPGDELIMHFVSTNNETKLVRISFRSTTGMEIPVGDGFGLKALVVNDKVDLVPEIKKSEFQA